jgi:transposase, IS5 family
MNKAIKQYRYVIVASFGTLKRRFIFSQASYFGLEKMLGQNYLKAMCLNLLKAMHKENYS